MTRQPDIKTVEIHQMIRELQPEIRALVGEMGGFPGRLIRPEEAAFPAPPPDGDIPRLIDESRLKPEATLADVEEMCEQARRLGFGFVLVNPIFMRRAADLVAGSDVVPGAVVAFPFGAVPPDVKAREARRAVQDGAREIDMVLPIGELRAGDNRGVVADILAVVREVHRDEVKVKVILETAYLDPRQKVAGCLAVLEAGADFVKTSTGFAPKGATVDDVQLMRSVVGSEIGVKAAGGIRTLADARALLQAGATRLGTSSGAKIVAEIRSA